LYIPNCDFYRTDREGRHKSGTVAAVMKGIPHTSVHLTSSPLLSVQATAVCIPTGNIEMLLATVYKLSQRLWRDTDITELLGPEIILS
jgi:hypothetical protein